MARPISVWRILGQLALLAITITVLGFVGGYISTKWGVAVVKPGAIIQRAQRQHNLELLQYVAESQPCCFESLMGMFGDPAGDPRARSRFSTRLSYLVGRGHLEAVNVNGQRRWTLPPMEASVQTSAGDAVDSSPVDARVCSVAAPRQISVLDAPPYVPDPDCALRAGALDYKRIASRGVRC